MTNRFLDTVITARDMLDLTRLPGTFTSDATFTGTALPDGTQGVGWTSRNLYSTYVPAVNDLDTFQPNPGVNGFTLVVWIDADSVNMNPTTGFYDYTLVSLNDDSRDTATSASKAWGIVTGGSNSQIGFTTYQDPVVANAITVTSGWHMYAWVCDCAAGAAPIKSYKDGVLIGTTAGNVTAKVDTSTWISPSLSLGAHGAGALKSLIIGVDQQIAQVSVFKTALTTTNLLDAYNVMTA